MSLEYEEHPSPGEGMGAQDPANANQSDHRDSTDDDGGWTEPDDEIITPRPRTKRKPDTDNEPEDDGEEDELFDTAPDPEVDPEAMQNFINNVVRADIRGGASSFWASIQGKTSIHWVDNDGPVTHADLFPIIQKAEKGHVAVGLVTRRERSSDGTRGGASDCAYGQLLWADIDIVDGSGAHKKREWPVGGGRTLVNPDSMESARSLIAAFPVPPSTVVDSGHGVHCYWLLDTPVAAADLAPLIKGWGAVLVDCAAALGFNLDPVFDLPRAMRLPGTLNFKDEPPAPCQVTDGGSGSRYSLDEFTSFIAEHEAKKERERAQADSERKAGRSGPGTGWDTPGDGGERPGDWYNRTSEPVKGFETTSSSAVLYEGFA